MSVKLAAGTALDTLAQLPPDTSQVFPQKNLSKRARSKYVTNIVASPLSNLRSPLEKSYKQTLQCANQLTEARGKITGLYCNQRWCLVCARIRTAKLIHGYMPALRELGEKWFVTLTIKNVKGARLKAARVEMHRVFKLINRHIREKKKIKYSYLRKFECTSNEDRNDFHPHFHMVLSCRQAAKIFVTQWLERFPRTKAEALAIKQEFTSGSKGQDIRPADNDSCMELFKYFTKIVTKDKKGSYKIRIQALDTIFRATKGIRTFQAGGIIKEVSEDVEPEQAELTHRDIEACWSWYESDWICKETGEVLTNYTPSENIKKIAQNVVVSKYSDTKFGSLLQSPEYNSTTKCQLVPLSPVRSFSYYVMLQTVLQGVKSRLFPTRTAFGNLHFTTSHSIGIFPCLY